MYENYGIRAILRRRTATNIDKLSHAYLADIATFKEIISNTASYHEVETQIDEIQDLREDYLDPFTFFASFLQDVGNSVYRKHSL